MSTQALGVANFDIAIAKLTHFFKPGILSYKTFLFIICFSNVQLIRRRIGYMLDFSFLSFFCGRRYVEPDVFMRSTHGVQS